MVEKKKTTKASQVPSYYLGVGHVVQLSTNVTRACHHCTKPIPYGGHDFGEKVNHYIIEHGYKLLHVGGETSHDADGNPWHSTVAVLGRGAP